MSIENCTKQCTANGDNTLYISSHLKLEHDYIWLYKCLDRALALVLLTIIHNVHVMCGDLLVPAEILK